MTDNEDISSIIGDHLSDAIAFDGEDRADARIRALEYLQGVMHDLPNEAGRSSSVTSELSDVISWMMPGLMRVFAGAGGVVEYQAREKAGEKGAEEATEYVQAIFESECEGYTVLYDWFYEALLFGNGVVKYYWEPFDKKNKYGFSNILPEQLSEIVDDKSVKVTSQAQNEDGTFDLFIERTDKDGRLRITALPNEEFLIDRFARSLDDARFVAHRTLKTRSDLIEMGYDREQVEEAPGFSNVQDDGTNLARGNSGLSGMATTATGSDLIEYYECYIRHDVNDDGIAELMRVCAIGTSNSPAILSSEEWDDDESPFADISPERVPHSWKGRSIADLTIPLQRVNTALLRQTLDNLYLTNRPQRVVNANMLENPEQITEASIGKIFLAKGNADSRMAVHDLVVPFAAQHSLTAMQYMSGILQKRTGVNQASISLDGDALTPQTATAKQIEHDQGYSRIELIARNFAETGVKRLFRGILRLVKKHQEKPKDLKIKNDWVTFDPKVWNSDMDVRVNVGLGTGTRERDLMMLRSVALEQDKVIQQFGPENPIVTPSMWIKTRQRMVEAAGLKDSDQYFASITDAQFVEWQKNRGAAAKPDPKEAEAQGKLALQKMQTEAKIQNDQNKLQADIALKQQEMQQEAQLAVLDISMGRHGEGVTNIRGAGGI